MSELSQQDITKLLRAWNLGEEAALHRLVPTVYKELHRLASACMTRERAGHTLQTTALVHEAYLRLAGAHGIKWRDRGHFYAVAASMMRRILVDWARERRTRKRGGDLQRVPLDEALPASRGPDLDLVALDEALQALAGVDERKSKVVELRYFGGLGVKETAEALEISPATVVRDWEFSKAWLVARLKEGGKDRTIREPEA